MIRINLLPVKAAQKKEQARNQIIVAGAFLLVTCGVCYFLYDNLQGQIAQLDATISRTRTEIKNLEKKIGEVNKYKKLQEDLQNKLNVLADLKESKAGPVHLMDELIEALPDKLWVNQLVQKGDSISLAGVGLTEDDVATFMTRLEASPYYRNVELKVTKQKVQDGLRLQNFELSCRMEQPKKLSAGK